MSASVLYALVLALSFVALTAMIMVLRELSAIHRESQRLTRARLRYRQALRDWSDR
jgi:hypothetical protein